MRLDPLTALVAPQGHFNLKQLIVDEDGRCKIEVKDGSSSGVLAWFQYYGVYCADRNLSIQVTGALNRAGSRDWVYEAFDTPFQAALSADTSGMDVTWEMKCYLVSLENEFIFVLAEGPPIFTSTRE